MLKVRKLLSEEFGELTIIIDDETGVWFVANEIYSCLKLKRMSIKKLYETVYSDNIMNEYYMSDEILVEDDDMEQVERNHTFKDLLHGILIKMNPLDVRIIKKKFGIEYPFEMTIQEIAESEGMAVHRVKSSINNSIQFITNNINEKDKATLIELLK